MSGLEAAVAALGHRRRQYWRAVLARAERDIAGRGDRELLECVHQLACIVAEADDAESRTLASVGFLDGLVIAHPAVIITEDDDDAA